MYHLSFVHMYIVFFFFFFKFGTGKLAQQLRVLAYLAEDSSLVSKHPCQDHSSLRPEDMDGGKYIHTDRITTTPFLDIFFFTLFVYRGRSVSDMAHMWM